MPSATYTAEQFATVAEVLTDVAQKLTQEPKTAFTRNVEEKKEVRQVYFGQGFVVDPPVNPFEPTDMSDAGDPSSLLHVIKDMSEANPTQVDLADRLLHKKEELVIKFGNFETHFFRAYHLKNGAFQVVNIELCS